MFLHSLQPLLACLQEVSDLCLVNPTTNSTLLEWQEVAGKERSHPLVGDAEVMPNLPEKSLPLQGQTHTQGTPTHCCGGVGDVLGSKGHKVGGLGHASLCCAPMQSKAGLGITGQQQDKVPKPIEGVGESIQSGDVRVPEGTSWGPKEMEREMFWAEEEEQMLMSFQGGEQPQSCSVVAQQSPLAYCKVWLMRGVHAQLSALAQHRQSLGTHRGWVACILHSQPSVSSQQTWHRTGASPHAGSTRQMLPAPCLQRNVMGCVRVLALPVLDAWGILGQGNASSHLPVAVWKGRLHVLSCQPSSKLPPWYRHRTPAPAGLGDAVRSILTELSSGSEIVGGSWLSPAQEATIPTPCSWSWGVSLAPLLQW